MSRQSALSPGNALIALMAALAVVATRAHADPVRVTPSVTVSERHESNVFYDDRKKESDWITSVDPRLSLEREGERGHSRIWAGLNTRTYMEFDELNAVDRLLGWDLERRLGARFSVFSEGRVAYFENLDPVADGDNVLGSGRPDERDTQGHLGLSYVLTPVSRLSASLGYLDSDYSSGDSELTSERRDSETWWGGLSYTHSLNPRDQILASLRYRETDFSNIGTGEETDDTVAGSFQWTRSWSPRWSTDLSAGLRWLESETVAGDDTSLGFVGGAELRRALKRGELSLSYQRETRPSSGLGTTLDTDIIEARYESRLSERLSLKLTGGFVSFRSADDSLVNISVAEFLADPSNAGCVPQGLGFVCARDVADEVDSTSLTASIRLDWRIRRRLSTFVSYQYRDQTSDGSRATGDYDNHRVMFGFRFAYPIDFN